MANPNITGPVSIFIYALFDPRNGETRYIGKTKCIPVRMKAHRFSFMRKGSAHYPVSLWIKSLVNDGVEFAYKIINICNEDNWIDTEIKEIADARRSGCRLLNVTEGGEGASYPSTPERNAKISAATKGKKISPETRAKLSSFFKGRKVVMTERRIIANRNRIGKPSPNRGRVLSAKHRDIVLAALHKPEVWKKAALKRSKRWIITFPDGKEVEIVNLASFARENGLDVGCLNKVAYGSQGRKSHKGFKVRPMKLAGQTVPVPDWDE